MEGLIDTGLLSGQHEVTTVLRPERLARPVAVDDMPGAVAEMRRLSQTWGGAGHPLLPVGEAGVPAPYWRLLETEEIDRVGGLQRLHPELPWRVGTGWGQRDYFVPLLFTSEPLDRLRTVRTVELDPDDPWAPVYAAVLGTWPDVPDPELLDSAYLLDTVRFEDMVPVERIRAVGSLDDLTARLIERAFLTPRQASNILLAAGQEPDTSFFGPVQQSIPESHAVRRAAGPNIVVAVSPGSVEDIALLWNLRAAHGDTRVLPIGMPTAELTADALRRLQEPGTATMFGGGGGKIHLTSVSVPTDQLAALAAETRTGTAVQYEDLLTFGHAPGRVQSHLALWQEGHARLSPLSDSDRADLRGTRATQHKPDLVLSVTVPAFRLPADGTMRGVEFFGRFAAGAAQVQVSELRREAMIPVVWPSSWTSLAAVAHSRGLKVSESEPGLAAATLIRSLGSVDRTRLLQHPPLIDLLYRMAERTGMTWLKDRWTAVHRELRAAGTEQATLDAADARLNRDDPGIAPSGEGRALPFHDFVDVLGRVGAENWVAWAERRHLIVRGAQITCPVCKTTSWLPMGALPPPVTCAGCGRQIEQPYNPRSLDFTYRIGEPLRRVLETDSLGHVLALHWAVQLFGGHRLVGAHPGVTFTDETGRNIGEADVLLLFADGTVVPVEVKRRPAGIAGAAEQKMDMLREALQAPYDILVVTQPARDCPDMPALGRSLPASPRLLLTNDQLHRSHIFWAPGDDPFGWAPLTEEQEQERGSAFRALLAKADPDAPRDWLSETLLDASLGAYRPDEQADPSDLAPTPSTPTAPETLRAARAATQVPRTHVDP